MAWLGALIGGAFKKIATWLGPALVQYVAGEVQAWLERRRVKRENERKAREAREQTEKAQTPEEREKAASETQGNW